MLCASIKSNEGNAVFAPGFLQEIVDVKFHRALRDIQIPGHFRIGSSCKDQLQDLALSGGELILRRKAIETLLFASDLDGRGQVDPMIQEEKSEDTYFAFANEKSKLFSFGAKFEAGQLLNVTAIVTMQDGSVRSVPMTWAGTEGDVQKYVGELYLEGNTDDHVFHADSIPVGFEINWDAPDAPVPDEKTLYEQALASAKERQQAREDMLWTIMLPATSALIARKKPVKVIFFRQNAPSRS